MVIVARRRANRPATESAWHRRKRIMHVAFRLRVAAGSRLRLRRARRRIGEHEACLRRSFVQHGRVREDFVRFVRLTLGRFRRIERELALARRVIAATVKHRVVAALDEFDIARCVCIQYYTVCIIYILFISE